MCGLLSIVPIVEGSVIRTGQTLVLFGTLAWSVASVINKKVRTTQVFAFFV